MGYYNVVKPCVVGKFHYARPTTQPIEVDDETAAPLVESGSLEPYRVASALEDLDIRTWVGPLMSNAGKDAAESFVEGVIRTMPDVAEVAEAMEPIEVELPDQPKPGADPKLCGLKTHRKGCECGGWSKHPGDYVAADDVSTATGTAVRGPASRPRRPRKPRED